MEQTDQELWRAYNSGDQEAFGTLFNRHKGKVFNFALRMLGSRPDAEDVTSDTFIQLFHKRFQDDGRAKLSTWLFTVARNACLSRLRSAKHVVSLWFSKEGSEDYEQWDIPDDHDSPSEALGKRETARAVRQALSKLPSEQKEALILREYFRKDYAEISQILECSLEKVKVLIFRGRERLRMDLAGLIKEDV
jgi:RNA polymerase sigma-70 factor (ECF subfamily)